MGLELLPDARILVCDAKRGLLALDTGTADIEVLTGPVHGEPMRFCNNAAVARSGEVCCSTGSPSRTASRCPRTSPSSLSRRRLPGPSYAAGLIWVTIASPRDPILERLQRAPMPVRRTVWKLPEALQPRPKRTVRVVALDDDGNIVHDRSADAASFHMATGVREHDGVIWVGSLVEPAVASFEV